MACFNTQVNTQKHKRILWIDAWRGAAVLGMIIVHIVMALDFGGVAGIDSLDGGWYWLTQLVRFSFLGLVGVSMVIMLNAKHEGAATPAYRKEQLLRVREVGKWALMATAASWVAYPEWFIRFGILHLIAVSILLCVWIAHRPIVAFLFGQILALAGFALHMQTTTHWFMHWVGARAAYPFSSIDFFPLLPWLALPLFGISLGHLLYRKNRIQRIDSILRSIPGIQWFAAVGRRSLTVYIWQGGVFLAVVFVWRILFF